MATTTKDTVSSKQAPHEPEGQEPKKHEITILERRDDDANVLWLATCLCGWKAKEPQPTQPRAIDEGRDHLNEKDPNRTFNASAAEDDDDKKSNEKSKSSSKS